MGNSHSEQEQQPEKSLGRGDIEKGKPKETEKTNTKVSTPFSPTPKLLSPVPPSQFKGIPDFTVNMGQASLCPLQATLSLSSLSTESPMSMQAIPTPSSPSWHTPIRPPRPSQSTSLPKPHPQGPSQEAAWAPNPQPTQQRPALVAPNPQPSQQRPAPVAPNPQPLQQRTAPVAPNPQPSQQRPAPVAPNPQPSQQRPAPVAPNPQPTQQRPAPVAPNPQPTQQRPVAVKAVKKASLRSPHNTSTPSGDTGNNKVTTGSTENRKSVPIAPPTATTKPIAPPTATTKPIAPPTATTKPIAPPTATTKPIAPPTATTKPIAPPTATTKPIAPPTATTKPIAPPTATTKPIAPPTATTKPIAPPTATTKPIAPPTATTKPIAPPTATTKPIAPPTATTKPIAPPTATTKPIAPPTATTKPIAPPTATTKPIAPPTATTKPIAPPTATTKPIAPPTATTKPARRLREPIKVRRPDGTPISYDELKAGLPETEKTSTPSGDTGNRNKGTTSSTENKDKPSGSLKVPPNFVLSKKILKKIEHRMEYVKKQESLPPAPTPLRQAAVRAALNGVVPHLKPAHREAKAQKGKTSKSDDDFNTAAQTIQPACQPQNNPEPASKPDKPPGTLAAPVPNNFSFSLGTTTPSAQTQKEKPSKTQPQAQTKAAPEAQGAGSTPSGGTTSGTGKPAGTGSSSRLTFSPYSVCGRFQAARLRLKQMREDRSRAQPAEGSREDRSRAQPAEGSREDRSRAQPADGSREDRSRAQPADGSRENQLSTELLRASPRAPAQPLTPTPASAPPRPLTPTPASAPPRPLTPTPALSRYRGPITTKQGQKLSRGQAEARATTESNKQPEPKPSTEEASGFTMTHYTDWHLSNAQWPMFDEATQLMERFQKYSNEFHYPDGFSTFSMSTTLGSKVTLREVADPTEVDTAFEEWYSGMNPFTPKTTNPSTATTTTTNPPQLLLLPYPLPSYYKPQTTNPLQTPQHLKCPTPQPLHPGPGRNRNKQCLSPRIKRRKWRISHQPLLCLPTALPAHQAAGTRSWWTNSARVMPAASTVPLIQRCHPTSPSG
ncbi:adhesive plaque matrix protein isoform X2 [Coregonus clupeaformis]|uniref:adhesive plaque matrix protein isoform X2 n=1 Tax=Coregonus clupeaformis TaxID=59861 RepID=UPI001E1C81CB|nr:adhesive plaque matrix protein isoform X2 [Coregonus clupeaformis]